MKSKDIESCSSRLAACPTGSSNGLHARLAQALGCMPYFGSVNNFVANDIESNLGIEGQSKVSVEAAEADDVA